MTSTATKTNHDVIAHMADPSSIWHKGDKPTVLAGSKVYAEGRVLETPGPHTFYITGKGEDGRARGMLYVVSIEPASEHCSCPDYMNKRRFKHSPCKHMYAAVAKEYERRGQLARAISRVRKMETEGD